LDPDGVKRKAVKKPTSKRVIPIHSALIRHGLLDYFKEQTDAGASRPFERGWKPWNEPDRGEFLYSHYVSRWGSAELAKLKQAGVLTRDERDLGYFHSMRHAQTNHYAKRGVHAEYRSSLHGQKVPYGGENGERYLTLRHDVPFLSKLVEEHLGEYAAMLDSLNPQSCLARGPLVASCPKSNDGQHQ
jgi:hypothetical protein